jgi:predicted nucleic acid-binding protein
MNEPRTAYIFTDANIIFNFSALDYLELLVRLPDSDFVIPNEVLQEITRPIQREAVQGMIDTGLFKTDVVEGPEAVAIYAELHRRLGSGESACLTLAQMKNGILASDEKRALRRLAIERIGPARIVGTQDLLVRMIKADIITVEQADLAKNILAASRFKMKIRSFEDLLE